MSAYLPNTGRLRELLAPGTEAWLRPATAGAHVARRTTHDLLLVRVGGELISVDSRTPNILLEKALRRGELAPFAAYSGLRREARLGSSRLDFVLSAQALPPCWIEAKSVTLVERGIATFPDAPTIRGRRHLGELALAAESGSRAAAIFVVQRSDAQAFSPNDRADPEFGAALRKAALSGVRIMAISCSVELRGIKLGSFLPVDI